MKHFTRPLPLTLCGLVAVLLLLFLFSSRPDSSSAPTKSTSHSSRNADPSSAPAAPAPAPAPPAAQNPPAAALAVPTKEQPTIDHPLLPAIQRVIAEQWTDAPQKLASRRRTRIVEANFKYPLLRLEETVTTDPATGLEKPTLLRASVADHLMIGLKPGVTTAQATAALLEKGYTIRAVEEGSFLLAQLPQHLDPADQTQAAQDIAALEEFIDHAEPDYLVFPCLLPNDPAYTQGKMWGLHNPGTAAGTKADADIDAPEAWDIRTDASSIIVAVTDTGIQYNHQDLLPNMWTHPANGTYGFDAYDNDNDPMDIGGHGTHCAGTIGARGNNAIGLTGVAWQVKLMGVRFLGPNGGSTSDSIRAVNYARQNGAHIISASWGGGGYSQSLYNAIKACGDAGIPFIAAAGNSSANNDSTPHYPSSYDLDTIVSVASTTAADALSPFSCYGRNSVDIGAPGSDIWSAYIGSNTAYKSLNGTSMATPHVSGALALAMAHFPTENTPALLRRLYTSVDKISALNGKCKTGGRLNLAKLLGTTATPPLESDTFATAHRFEGHYGEWFGTNQEATSEPGETNTKTHWFAFRPAHAGLVTLDFTSDVIWYAVAIYEGSEKATLKPLQVSDIFGGNVRKFTLTPKADTEYRVMLATDFPNKQSFLVKYALTPLNDMFADATAVTGELFSVNGYNRSATAEPFEKNQPHAKGGQGKSVWWRWTAPADMNVTLNTRGSAFDTIMAVYTGSTPDALTEIAANDDRNALDWTSQVQFAATAGTTYHIAVDSYRADAAGDITLNAFRSGTLNILRHPAPLAVELGKRAVFEVSAFSNTDITYQWFLNGQAIPGQTASNIVIDPVRAIDLGTYHVQIATAENTLTSNPAALTEKQIPPRLTWSSGNQSVSAGTLVSFSATFSGSTPMTYSWTKNGQPYTGSNSILHFGSAAIGDSGQYRLTASNTAGSEYVDFNLSVIASPWERWEWRRPGITSAPITDIKVYGTEAYAVSGTVLYRSSDGVNWNKTVFPQGYTGTNIAKIGTLFICFGRDRDNVFKIATSNDNAVTWTIATSFTFGATWGQSNYYLVNFGSALIACSPFGNDFYRSTNGLTWTQLTATNLSGQSINLSGNGRIATNGNTAILASKSSGVNNKMRFFRSTNGINWTEHETDATGTNTQTTAAFALGKFFLYDTHMIFSSTNATSWTAQQVLSNGYGSASIFATNGTTVFGLNQGSDLIRYYETPDQANSRSIQPNNSHFFSAAASYGNRILYGTDKGLLGIADDQKGIKFPKEVSSTLQNIQFVDRLFVAKTTNTSLSAVADYISGDGVNWMESKMLESVNTIWSGYAFGKYWSQGISQSDPEVYVGYNPADCRINPNDGIGFATRIYYVEQTPNGSALAITSNNAASANPIMILTARPSGASNWTTSSFPLVLRRTSKFAALGNRWYSNVDSTESALIYTSSDGLNWTSTMLTGANAKFVQHGGKSWCIYQSGTSPFSIMAASSNDGLTWTTATTSGIPYNTNRTFARKVVSFGGYLVMLGGDSNLYYSEDGVTWLRGFAPGMVTDIATGQGQLVAIMQNGGIVQTGSRHAGVNAPRVSIVSPQTRSRHLVGSRIAIEGVASDPEGGTVSYECYMDATLVASGVGNSFRFHVVPTDLRGHTITVRATDAQGLCQIDSVRLFVSLPVPSNLLENGPDGPYIPFTHAAILDGVFYAIGKSSIYRSIDGINWADVPMPATSSTIVALASGNGALVIQYKDGSMMTTRDGINWTTFQMNQTNLNLGGTLRFSDGFFTATFTVSSLGGGIMFSEDGLSWELGANSYANLSPVWTARSKEGIFIGADNKLGVCRSNDQGYNWFPIPEIPQDFFMETHGIYADNRFIVMYTNLMYPNSKFFVSSDSLNWTEYALPSGINNSPVIGHLGGLYFMGSSKKYSHISSNGLDWQKTTHDVNAEKIAHSLGVFVAQSTNAGVVTSRDAITWKPCIGLPSTVSRILANDNRFLALDMNGAVYTSFDGEIWAMRVQGSPNLSATGIARSLANIHGTLVVAGTNILMTSTNGGSSWFATKINDQPASTARTYHKVVSSGSECLVFEGTPSAPSIINRSVDGLNFTPISGVPAKTWNDMATNGVEWMLLGRDGTLYRSLDGGITWNQVAITGIVRGGAVAWFNERWIIVGATSNSGSVPYVAFTLEAGDVLESRGNVFSSSSQLLNTHIAHGKLLLWQNGVSAALSSDGITWQGTNLIPGGSSASYDIFSTVDGFVAFGGTSFTNSPSTIWKSDTNGTVWQQVAAPFRDFSFAENFGNRVFLFSNGIISEWHDKDLSITLSSLSSGSLGVGDQVEARVQINNLGANLPPGSTWRVTGWLAKNRFYGDTKNILLGTHDINASMPSSGASAEYDVSFTVPNEILTGDNYLIISLASTSGLKETNIANNTVISDTAAITIPEWSFNVVTNGNGQVNRDFAAMRYPHKAQVSLTASAGKGATFTGWSGDGYSPNNQITILMDGNKTLAANFSNRATLQVFVRGAGVVNGLAEMGSYDVGQSANLTAAPAAGWVFSHWSGDASSSQANQTVLMDQAKTITAHFRLPMASWKSQHFSTAQLADAAISGDNSDPDGDGLKNWQEYLHASHPLHAQSRGVTPHTIEGGTLRCLYTRNLGAENGGTVFSQASRDLTQWNAPGLQERIISTVDGIETIEVRFPATAPRGYLRMHYQKTNP